MLPTHFRTIGRTTVTAKKKKNQHAFAMAKLGASKGGHARAAKMTPKALSEAGRKAVEARWARQRELGLVPKKPQRPNRKPKSI
jgi:hypothetical protein